MVDLLSQITEVVTQQIGEILESNGNEDEPAGYITAKDFMNDFATEEFITKNIRVRPISGVTGKDIDDKQSERVSRNNLMGGIMGDPTDDEEKFNKMVNLEMEDQRKKIKTQQMEVERKKQAEVDKRAKDQAKKK